MGDTLTEKILGRASGRGLRAGDIAVADVDFAMVQDINGPRVVEVVEELGAERVFDPERIMFVFDHYSPEPTPLAAGFHRKMRRAARKFGIPVHGIGSGICHQLVVESGHARPGRLVVGTDSHSSTYGGLGAFGVSLGATEMAVALITGRAWFKVPQAIRVTLAGSLPEGVTGKDVALHLVGAVGEEGGLYKSFEFAGEGLASIPVHDRLTVANLVVDCGAKAGLFPADPATAGWLSERGAETSGFERWHPDTDARYADELEIDLSSLEPLVAAPHAVDNVVPLSEVEGTPVTAVFIGTCTNGRLEDYREAGAVLEGRRVAGDVRLLCYPASREVQRAMLEEDVARTLVEAGAVLMPPGCGPCAGLHGGVAGEGDVVFSTSSRNYRGRMGSDAASIFLGSPAVAAATAVAGRIAHPSNLPARGKGSAWA